MGEGEGEGVDSGVMMWVSIEEEEEEEAEEGGGVHWFERDGGVCGAGLR
jgi:hypothetical protein